MRQGCGEKIKDGETLNILCRFVEKSIQDTTMLFNDTYYIYDPDIMSVTRTGSTYSATFVSGVMLSAYGASVPEGWLVPLQYVKIGRLTKPEDELEAHRAPFAGHHPECQVERQTILLRNHFPTRKIGVSLVKSE